MNKKEPQVLLDSLKHYKPYTALRRALENGEKTIDVKEAELSFLAMVAAALHRFERKRLCVVVPTDQDAENFIRDTGFFNVSADVLPWWKTGAYRSVSVRSRIFGERVRTLADLIHSKASLVVASARAFMTPAPPRGYLSEKLLVLNRLSKFDPENIADRLSQYGYLRVPRVSLPGEYALRGEVLDIFMPGDDTAFRIQFEFDMIEKITAFDPMTQTASGKLDSILLRPIKEVMWEPETLKSVQEKGSGYPQCMERMNILADSLQRQEDGKAEEYWFGSAFDTPHSVVEYFDSDTIILFANIERILAQQESARKEYAGMYRQALRYGAVPPPERCLVEFGTDFDGQHAIVRSFALKDETQLERLPLGSEPGHSYFGNIAYLKEDISNFEKAGYRQYIAAGTDIQAQRLASLINNENCAFLTGDLSAGFTIPGLKLRIIQEQEIFGRKKRTPKSLAASQSSTIENFIELAPGDFVVHVNYGIGKFLSIERMKVLGNERDYIKIAYADAETVFVPIEQANLVQRYIGNEGEAPRLDSLGSKSWENRKRKVRKSVEELAERLIRIYARRKAAKGYAFPRDNEWQTAFEASFPYDETIDQLRCIDEIKKDMESPRPMDRLVCGDVGYGKTEIALRACFKAIAAGKQVAFLAPTTILAEQHYENFKERIEQYPVTTSMLSRLVAPKVQKKVLKGLADGSIDMVVGTHRILQKDVVFKDLGLLVIDEEQRFGVKDKERLKEMKAGIDCLTLTATPIPRTLHMSLLKIRDMSILQTPPAERQPIETFVEEYKPEVVARAIRNEIERGGQVFYLHNRIESLQEVEAFLRSIVPEVLTESAHGQMEPRELEDIMHRFIHGAFHVLVSTTIIENGIDIPNVNTIIIDRADMYGVSQLYQLRGRVGRSDRQAYAYLLYPDKRALTEIAMKRLQVISDFTELGSGFKIAMKDLEVRGAGNLLGREQSGDIYSVGFDMYLKLLDDAVNALSGFEPEEEPYLELEYSGFIPEDYINQPMLKMEIYKKIASVSRQHELDALQEEMENRFGPMPEEVQSLLSLAEIRVICRKLSVASLREKKGMVHVEFSKVSKISVERLVRLIKESNGRIRLDPEKPNAIILMTKAIGLREKSEFIRERLASLL